MQRQEPGAPKKFHNYRDMLKDMGQISTVEQFFQYFVYMKKPTEMPREIDLFFFREGEIPMWEVRLSPIDAGRSRPTAASGSPRSRRTTT